MSINHKEDFKQEAVQIALSSGLPRARIASDLGVGKSTHVSGYRFAARPICLAPQTDLAKESERLRVTALWALPMAEVRVLREEWEILKKAQGRMGSSSRAKNHEVRVC
jgi:transposase